ncbi:MAG: S8 family peptidase [Candidatus Woesearchaeota archaeon]
MGVIKQIWIYIVLTCMLITSAQALSTQTFQIHEGSNEFVLNLNPTIVSEIDKQKIINNLDTYKQKQVITDYIEREDLIKIIFNPLVEIEEIKISKKMIKIRERPDGYIIELNTPPIIVHKKELENEIIQYHQMQLIHEKQHQQNNFITPSQNFNDSAEIKINYANYNKIYNEFISSYVLAEQISIAKENQRELITSNFNTIKNLTKTLEQQDSRGIIATIGSLVNRKQKEITPEPQFTNEFYYTFAGITVRNISPEKIETIKNLDFVKNVHPNYRVRVALDASVPVIQDGIPAGFVGHNGENCNETDQPCLTGEGITIAIIDTGVDYTHPDLGECTQQQFLNENCEKVIGGYDFVNNNQDSFDDQGHGTHVAAIAAGNGYFKGVAPNARILAYKVLDESGGGFMSDIISGIEEAVLDGADILSLSLGGFGDPDDPVSISADNAVLDGKVVVVAAGNDGEYGYQTIGSPGTARKVITVGAIDNDLRMAEFSSKGPVVWEGGYLFKPDIVAPGVEICAAKSSEDKIRDLILTNEQREVHCTENNQHISISGTSMATPHVSGAIALLVNRIATTTGQ